MLLDHTPPFERFTLIQDVQTEADLVLTGHDHTGYGIYKRADGKIFYNPGALGRLAASVAEMERDIKVGLLTVDGIEADIKEIKLECAKPGEEVLDRSRIEAAQERSYAMEAFTAAMETAIGNRVLVDINQIVETIAGQEKTAPHVVKALLDLIDAQREKVTA